jgi:hypothetical protein
MENAFRAKVDFDILMGSLHISASGGMLDVYAELHRDEKLDMLAEERLEWLRPILAGLARDYGCRYEVPILSDNSKRILAETPLQFIKCYVRQLKMLDMDPFSTSYI